ncbi:MAG: protein phosphatase [Clostridiales bacterium]|nr:protein phosphatase [Clostridiales bacterium]
MSEELDMDEDLNEDEGVAELLVQKTEENQTRKILEILNDCKDLEEAKRKVKAMLEK